ncbi:MAG: hypothetical protein E7328_00270 [Clostridiales bacterium]|nr:hypothetical protein [Clostridiales bacterium]
MASQYYGKSGDYIKEIQKLLNDKGASISVDGVWGDETEDAYQRLGTVVASAAAKNSGGISTTKNSYGLSYYNYDAPTDEELLEQARQAVAGEYDAKLSAEEEKTQRLTDALNRSIGELDPVYQQRLDVLDDQFEEARQYLANNALKRNMGRSTHYLNMVNEANADHLSMVDAINLEYRKEVDAINQEILDLQKELLSNKGVLSAQRQSAMQKYLDQLKSERDDRILAMVKYNNDVRETELSLLAKEKAAAKSSRSGGSSSSKSSSTSYRETIMNEWNRLTKPGKIAFFDSYGDQIYAKNKSLYDKLKADVATYRKEGYFAAVNPQYNYYLDSEKPYRYTGPR